MKFSRTEMLIGADALEKLKNSRVAVFGVGGVGSYVVEALARSGVGALDLIDNDTVNITNINRQLIALHSTVGKFKVDCAKERILDINPCASVNVYKTFYLPDNADEFDFTQYDYVVDAVDTVTAKLEIIMRAKEAGVPVISAMGAGNKLDATKFVVTDIYKTKVCPLAKVMRKELKNRGVEKLKVVYSEEPALTPKTIPEACEKETTENTSRRSTPGSIAFVPSVAGLLLAQEVIKDLTM